MAGREGVAARPSSSLCLAEGWATLGVWAVAQWVLELSWPCCGVRDTRIPVLHAVWLHGCTPAGRLTESRARGRAAMSPQAAEPAVRRAAPR